MVRRQSYVEGEIAVMRFRGVLLLVLIAGLSLVLAGCYDYSVSGRVTDPDGNGIAGVTLAFSGGFGTASTGDDGSWSKSGLKGAVTITPTEDGWTFVPASREVSGAASDVNFSGTPVAPAAYTVSGRVIDSGGNGISGVTLTFGGGFGTVTTGNDGRWNKSGLSGTVTITPSKDGWAFEPISREVAGAANSIFFVGTLTVVPTYAVSGRIHDASGAGVAGVTVSFSKGFGTVTTGPDGTWSKTGLSGTVTVTPSLQGWRFWPRTKLVSEAAGNVDFLAEPTAPTTAPMKTLFYDDSYVAHFAKQALTNLEQSFTEIGEEDDFNTVLTSQAWDLIVIDNPTNFLDDSTLTLLKEFVESGGRLAISTWLSHVFPSHPLWATLGSTSGRAPDGAVHPVYRWASTHPILATPNSVPDFTEMQNWYGVDTFPGDATGTGTALAGITTGPAANSATLFVANNGRTIFDAFLLDDAVWGGVPNDVDHDGKADAVELWENQIHFLSKTTGTPPIRVHGSADEKQQATPASTKMKSNRK